MTDRNQMNPMVQFAENAAGFVAASQDAAIRLLHAEMQALNALLPGAGPEPTPAEDEARRRAEEAAVEETFDNMPV